MTVSALATAAITSDQKAWARVQQLDSEVANAIADMEEAVGPFCISPFLHETGLARGGVVGGSRKKSRRIQLTDEFDVMVESRSDWYFFAGVPYVKIISGGLPGDQAFARILQRRLREQGVEATVVQQS